MNRQMGIKQEEAGDGTGGSAGGGIAGEVGGGNWNAGRVQMGEAAARPYGWMPEKYHVHGEGGAFDLEGSARKLANSYGELERRMKETGLPPKDVNGYAWVPPEGVELDAEASQAFKERALAAGISTKQYDFLMGELLSVAPKMLQTARSVEIAAAVQALEQDWGRPGAPTFDRNMAFAEKAFEAFAHPKDKAAGARIGNDPMVLRLLAAIGRELQEDTSVDGQQVPSMSLEEIMRQPGYFDASHPDHAGLVAKARAHFEAQARRQAAQGG